MERSRSRRKGASRRNGEPPSFSKSRGGFCEGGVGCNNGFAIVATSGGAPGTLYLVPNIAPQQYCTTRLKIHDSASTARLHMLAHALSFLFLFFFFRPGAAFASH